MIQDSQIAVGITGHQNIPTQAIPYINDEIIKTGLDYSKVKCVSSLAIGADQLLAKLVLDKGGTLHAVIPCGNYEKTFKNDDSLNEYYHYLANASIIEKMPYDEPSEDAFYDAGCRIADLSKILIAIWDGERANGKGGTADIVEYARTNGKTVKVVWPEGVSRKL